MNEPYCKHSVSHNRRKKTKLVRLTTKNMLLRLVFNSLVMSNNECNINPFVRLKAFSYFCCR